MLIIFFNIKKIKNNISSYTYVYVFIFYSVSEIKLKTCFILIN